MKWWMNPAALGLVAITTPICFILGLIPMILTILLFAPFAHYPRGKEEIKEGIKIPCKMAMAPYKIISSPRS